MTDEEIKSRVIEIVAGRCGLDFVGSRDLVGNIDDKIARKLSPSEIADEVIFGEDV